MDRPRILREADHARRNSLVQTEIAEARAELAAVHQRLERAEAQRAEIEGHDWEYLLGATGLANHDVTLGRLSFALGAITMLVALGWGGAVLWRQRAGRQAP